MKDSKQGRKKYQKEVFLYTYFKCLVGHGELYIFSKSITSDISFKNKICFHFAKDNPSNVAKSGTQNANQLFIKALTLSESCLLINSMMYPHAFTETNSSCIHSNKNNIRSSKK